MPRPIARGSARRSLRFPGPGSPRSALTEARSRALACQGSLLVADEFDRGANLRCWGWAILRVHECHQRDFVKDCRMKRCRVRCGIRQLCCLGVLVGTKRMLGPAPPRRWPRHHACDAGCAFCTARRLSGDRRQQTRGLFSKRPALQLSSWVW